MPHLPLELIRQVVENLMDDVDDPSYRPSRPLSAVALSCRLLRHEAQRVLFRDPGELHTTTAAHKKTVMFVDTVSSSPERLALYVEIFKIAFDDWFLPKSDKTVQMLSNALKSMRNLKSLSVFQWEFSTRSAPNILQHVHSRLTSFIWAGYRGAASEAANIKTDFLQRQDNIKHLIISEFIEDGALKPISARICPRLRSLSAPYSLTEILLPGKLHVTSLQWTPPSDNLVAQTGQGLDLDFHSNPELISSELGGIRYLSYDIPRDTMPAVPSVSRISSWLTSLVCLEAHTCYAKQAEALSQFPCIKTLILNAGDGGDYPGEDDLTKILASCESLDHIDVEDDGGDFVRFKYDHFGKILRSHTINPSDTHTWVDDFDFFDD